LSTQPSVRADRPRHEDLTDPERSRLAELEEVVERGLTTFVEVGNALLEIRDQRLYRETHSTFEAYCRERWGFVASRARQLIAAAKTVTVVTAAGLPAPTTERQARELARRMREARQRLVRTDPKSPGVAGTVHADAPPAAWTELDHPTSTFPGRKDEPVAGQFDIFGAETPRLVLCPRCGKNVCCPHCGHDIWASVLAVAREISRGKP